MRTYGVIFFIATTLGLFLFFIPAHAAPKKINKSASVNTENRGLAAVEKNPDSSKRVALVIGNSSYANSPLKNPVNDAKDIASKLRGLGFEVIERNNLTTKQIGGTLREFRSKLAPGAVALVFYAGHGFQIKGDNYLPAVDADINSEEDVPNQSLSVKQIMDVLDESKSRLNLVFLDACRNNPYARSFRSADRGLARINAPSGTLISYATKPGSVAADGTGRNGLYTSKLLAQMDSNLQIEQSLKRVVTEVKSASKGKQEPWMEGSIEGDFCFGGCTSSERQTSSASSSPRPDSETEAWSIVKETSDVEVIRDFINEYPQGKFASSARLKLKELENKAKVAMSPRLQTTPQKQLPVKLVAAKEAGDISAHSSYPFDTPNTICSACHSTAFELHRKTVSKHRAVNCVTCHKDNKIPTCQSCHGTPHFNRFNKNKCGDCHNVAHDLKVSP